MTSSTSSIRGNTVVLKWLVALFAVAAVALAPIDAYAGARKRLVVLDFEGPKAEKFHDDLVKLLKKSHTVITTDKWNSAAEELDAGKVTEKNIKKVAKKLKIDGVIQGKIDKRRDEYIVQLKLRAGASGEIVGKRVDTKAEGARLDGDAARDVKDELLPAIDELEANRGGGGDDDDADVKPKKKPAKDDDGDDDVKPKKGFSKKAKGDGGDDDADVKPEVKPKKKPAKDDDDNAALATKHDDDDVKPKKKAKSDDDDGDVKPKKKVARSDDDDDGSTKRRKKKVARGDDDDNADVEASADVDGDDASPLSVGHRAIDAAVGFSFIGRRMTFSTQNSLMNVPPGYKSAPVAGATFDVEVFPLAISHKKPQIINGLGLEVLYDRVIYINSQKQYTDAMGNNQIAKLTTSESRYGFGAIFRYPIDQSASAPVVGGKLGYSKHSFSVTQQLPNNGGPTDVPNTAYSSVNIGAFGRYPATPKVALGLDLAYMVVTKVGDISSTANYGSTSANGFQAEASLEYLITRNVFLRAVGRVETIGMKFAANANTMANNRDGDPTTQDVTGARDTYYGGMVTAGYLY